MSLALTIVHVDMDAFFASVEQLDNPALRGKPVIVGGSVEGRGVVSAASYEARRFGVHSAMPTVTARRLCPDGIFLPVRMGRYAAIARQLREIFFSFTPLVEPLSLDEAFLDVRGCERLFGPAEVIAHAIKRRVRAETGLTASVGVAANKFLAKLASDLHKPDGLFVLPPEQVRAVLDPLPVGRLWGVGKKGEQRLHALGIRTVGQLAALPEPVLAAHWGDAGRHLWELAHGRDGRAVVPDSAARSVSTETTFPRDIGRRDVLRAWLLDLVDELGERLRRAGVRGRTVELKVRTSAFRTYSRSTTLAEPTDVTAELWQAASGLFEGRLLDDWLPVRLLGIGATNLTHDAPAQGCLFEAEWRRKQRALDHTLDAIRRQFGDAAIRRAGGVGEDPSP